MGRKQQQILMCIVAHVKALIEDKAKFLDPVSCQWNFTLPLYIDTGQPNVHSLYPDGIFRYWMQEPKVVHGKISFFSCIENAENIMVIIDFLQNTFLYMENHFNT